jgi:MFS family permease
LAATAFLFAAPGEYRTLFALTIVPGAIAVSMLFLVPETPNEPVAIADDRHRRNGPNLPKRFWGLMGILLLFSLGNSADAFLLLRLSDVLGNAAYIPLLWASIHIVKAGLSVYGGSLSDRIGRKRVIAAGWMIYAVVYVGFAVTASAAGLIAWFLLYGTYFGLAEGSEKALVADLTPAALRGSAFGFYNAALGVGTLSASILFGFLYERFGPGTAFGTGAVLAAAATVLLAVLPTGRCR